MCCFCRLSLQAFQARTALAPEQCLRYCFQPGATPLWPSASRLPAAGDIPLCPHCGAQRRFEFQVSLEVSSLEDCDLLVCGVWCVVCQGRLRVYDATGWIVESLLCVSMGVGD